MSRWQMLFRQFASFILIALSLAAWPHLSLAAPPVVTSIVRDGFVGPSSATQVGPAVSGVYTIPQSFGQLSAFFSPGPPGSPPGTFLLVSPSNPVNLFHSFSTFNVGAGDTVRFTTTSPSLLNVITRVTDGGPSQINGTIQLQPAAGSAPNFFFINPSGVTFGAGASVDVPASFYVSTAHVLKFGNGAEFFYADRFTRSDFAVSPPSAFGFFGPFNPRGTVNVGDANLATPNGALHIVAGDVTINNAKIQNRAGDIRVVAMGDTAGDVGVSGPVPSDASGTVSISNGGLLNTATLDANPSGSISVAAGSLTIDGLGQAGTGITTQARSGSSGNSGAVQVTVAGEVSAVNGGVIHTSTSGSGNAGDVTVAASSLSFATGNDAIGSSTFSTGSAGTVTVPPRAAPPSPSTNVIWDGSTGSSACITAFQCLVGSNVLIPESLGTASGGNLFQSFSIFNLDAGESATFTTQNSYENLITRVTGGTLSQINGSIALQPAAGSAPNFFFINPAGVTIGAGASVNVPAAFNVSTAHYLKFPDGNFYADPSRPSTLSSQAPQAFGFLGPGNPRGKITIDGTALGPFDEIAPNPDASFQFVAGDVALNSAMVITNTGDVRITAMGDAKGDVALSGTLSTALGTSIPAGSLSMANPGAVFTRHGGNVAVAAGTIDISGVGSVNIPNVGLLNSIPSQIFTMIGCPHCVSETGNAGHVEVLATQRLSITNGGFIGTMSFGGSNGGTVNVSAGSLNISHPNPLSSVVFDPSDPFKNFHGIGSVNIGTGTGGELHVSVAGQATITNAFGIFGLALGAGPGSVATFDAQSLIMNDAALSTSTFGGHAGPLTVTAGSVIMDAGSNIGSDTFSLSKGGTVAVNTGSLTLLNGSRISTETLGPGKAGDLTVNAERLTVDGTGSSITAEARTGSSGQTGNVTVSATDSILLSNGGKLSIENNATVADPTALTPTLLSVSAPTITQMNSSITAASTGNVAASDIRVNFGKQLFLDPSFITTSANTGNGGSIVIQGGGPLWLDSSQITTSAGGGFGGDITISVPFLIMDTGFIQANTQLGAAGGNVSINANAIIASGGLLNVGGLTPFAFDPNAVNFNVIQAAAPTGLSGNIAVTAPVVNLSGSLAGLTGNVLSGAGVGKSLCSPSGGSSLAQAGRGGMPASSSDLLTIESAFVNQDETAPARPDASLRSSSSFVLAQCP